MSFEIVKEAILAHPIIFIVLCLIAYCLMVWAIGNMCASNNDKEGVNDDSWV